MSRQTYRTWGFRFFLAGFICLILSVPIACQIIPFFVWVPMLWAKAGDDFLTFFLLPTIGFSLIVISFILFCLGSRKGDQA